MSDNHKIHRFRELSQIATRFRDDLNNSDFVLLYAYNGTGKTRISMEFKEKGKQKNNGNPDTLYFNAFTEDLFSWDNDLKDDTERYLELNPDSKFFEGFQELELDTRIRFFLQRYADFDFTILFEERKISFNRNVRVKEIRNGETHERTQLVDNIKVSRGEENIFIWCVFLAICQLAIDGAAAYSWVKKFYIDDPISSLDDNNAIAVASDLSQLLLKTSDRIKAIISSHHILFFNVMCNELKKKKLCRYFLFKSGDIYTLRKTDDTPFFQHVASLSELKQIVESRNIQTYHFNTLRNVLEKTSSFFGLNDFGKCIHGIDDEVLFERALNLLSHGNHSVYQPVEMNEDNKDLFIRILDAFLDKYQFELPALLIDDTIKAVEKEASTEPEHMSDKEEQVSGENVTVIEEPVAIEEVANSISQTTKSAVETIKTEDE